MILPIYVHEQLPVSHLSSPHNDISIPELYLFTHRKTKK